MAGHGVTGESPKRAPLTRVYGRTVDRERMYYYLQTPARGSQCHGATQHCRNRATAHPLLDSCVQRTK